MAHYDPILLQMLIKKRRIDRTLELKFKIELKERYL